MYRIFFSLYLLSVCEYFINIKMLDITLALKMYLIKCFENFPFCSEKNEKKKSLFSVFFLKSIKDFSMHIPMKQTFCIFKQFAFSVTNMREFFLFVCLFVYLIKCIRKNPKK